MASLILRTKWVACRNHSKRSSMWATEKGHEVRGKAHLQEWDDERLAACNPTELGNELKVGMSNNEFVMVSNWRESGRRAREDGVDLDAHAKHHLGIERGWG
eukprot:6183394-Pleurochrysis_carterae.AAC.5